MPLNEETKPKQIDLFDKLFVLDWNTWFFITVCNKLKKLLKNMNINV